MQCVHEDRPHPAPHALQLVLLCAVETPLQHRFGATMFPQLPQLFASLVVSAHLFPQHD